MSFICHIHNYTEYNEQWNVFSAFNPSKCTHLEQWAADCAAPGEQSWTSCQSRDSNPQPWVTSGRISSPTLYPLGIYDKITEHFLNIKQNICIIIIIIIINVIMFYNTLNVWTHKIKSYLSK